MNTITGHMAGLAPEAHPPSAEKPCSYDPGRSLLRSCRPSGLPGGGNLHRRTIKSMTFRLGVACERGGPEPTDHEPLTTRGGLFSLDPAAPARAFRGVLQGDAQLGQAPGTLGGAGSADARLATALALAKTGNKAVSRHGPRFCNRRGNNREVAPLPPVTVAPARVTILTKAEGETQWEKRAARMSRSLSRTRSRKGRAGRLLLESL
jgi:hypothetical protein